MHLILTNLLGTVQLMESMVTLGGESIVSLSGLKGRMADRGTDRIKQFYST